MKVFLTGATGFVGSHMLRRLLREGHEVRALTRRTGALPNVLRETQRLEEVEGDIASRDLASLVAGTDAVINLVGIIYQRRTRTFEAVHHHGTKHLVEAARRGGVTRFVQMSALGARPGNASRYHTTKFAAEEEVRKSGLSWTVLRPSLIFGPGSAFVEQMASVMRAAPLFRPIPGTGQYRFRPVHVDDVVECFLQSLTNPATTNQTVDLVGGEELTLDEIGNEIADCLGVRKIVLHVPIPIMRGAASFFSLLPMQPPVTHVQLRMLEEGSTADPQPMRRIFQVQPIGFRKGVREYLGRQERSTD
jgi:NADH dehydrogenase